MLRYGNLGKRPFPMVHAMTLSSSRVYQNPRNTIYHETEFKSPEEFLEIVRFDHCPAVVDGGRDKASFVRSEFLFAEVDGGISIATFRERFLGVCYFLNTSRHHQKEKNGVAADRFHVLFPIEDSIEDVRELDLQLRRLVEVYPFFDPQAKDATRFYYGNADTEVIYNSGRCLPLFDVAESYQKPITSVTSESVFDPEISEESKKIMGMARPMWSALYESGFYNERDPWITAMHSMKIEGFPLEDFLLICHDDEKTQKDARYYWGTAVPNGSAGMGTLIQHLRSLDPGFMKRPEVKNETPSHAPKTKDCITPPGEPMPTSVQMPWYNWFQPHVKIKEVTKKDKDGNKTDEATRTPLPTLENFEKMMQFYGITCRENLMKHKLEIHVPGLMSGEGKSENAPFGIINSILALNGLVLSDSRMKDYTLLMGHKNAYHPARDYFESLKWDGKGRVGELMETIGLAHGYDPKFAELLVTKWMISVVAAACDKGFKTRGVLVFQGDESIGKGSWFRNLFEHHEFFLGESDIDPHNKDSVSKAISHLVSELSELEKVFKRDMPAIKAFITSEKDSIRMPYERREEEYHRQSVFCASVNKLNFIDPEEKGTRFLSIRVKFCNYNRLRYEIDRSQLWAEIYQMWNQKKAWWLTQDEEVKLSAVNSGHREVDDIADAIGTYFDLDLPGELRARVYTATEIAGKIGYKTANKMIINKIGACLRRHGIEYTSSSRGKRGFVMPAERSEGEMASHSYSGQNEQG